MAKDGSGLRRPKKGREVSQAGAHRFPPPLGDIEGGRDRRRIAFTVCVLVLTLALAVTFIGVTGLTIGLWSTGSNPDTTPVTDLGFLALGALITIGFAAQLRAPEHGAAALQLSVAALLALGVAGLIGQRIEPLVGALALLGVSGIVVALHPARPSLHRLGGRFDPVLGGLTLVAALPAAAYAAKLLTLARHAGPSCFLGRCAHGDRFAELAALAIAIVLGSTVTAATRSRVVTWSVGSAGAVLGATSIVLPTLPGSLGHVGGALATAWAVVLVATVEAKRRATS